MGGTRFIPCARDTLLHVVQRFGASQFYRCYVHKYIFYGRELSNDTPSSAFNPLWVPMLCPVLFGGESHSTGKVRVKLIIELLSHTTGENMGLTSWTPDSFHHSRNGTDAYPNVFREYGQSHDPLERIRLRKGDLQNPQ